MSQFVKKTILNLGVFNNTSSEYMMAQWSKTEKVTEVRRTSDTALSITDQTPTESSQRVPRSKQS